MDRLDESVRNKGSYKNEMQLAMERVKEKLDNLKRESYSNQKIFLHETINLEAELQNIKETGLKLSRNDKVKIKAYNDDLETLDMQFDTKQNALKRDLTIMKKSNNHLKHSVALTRQAEKNSIEFGLKLEKKMKELTELLMNLPQQYSRDNLRVEVDNIKQDSQRLQDDVREVRKQLDALRCRLAEQFPSDSKNILQSINLTDADISKNDSKIRSIEEDIRQLQLKHHSLESDHQFSQLAQNP